MITKLFWAHLHRDLGELGVDVLGMDGTAVRDDRASQRRFLFSRADTIYGGSNQIQRNIIGERALACPRSRVTIDDVGAADVRRAGHGLLRGQDRASSPRRPAPASARPRPSAASRKAPPSLVSATPTSGGWARRPSGSEATCSRSPAT